jgi:cellulose synthase/poly-beta-1,6-N-acetylglucosamine synthase-like glycosyltransferase
LFFFVGMMSIWMLLTGSLLAGYLLLMGVYRYHFVRLKPFDAVTSSLPPVTFFSVIIPARNESTYIRACLQSVVNNSYPGDLFEIIVVDDHSEDDTAQQVLELQSTYPQISLLRLQDYPDWVTTQAYKKKAIELAISKSKGSWIVTTDADGEVPVNWLLQFDNYIQKNEPVFVAAPVMYYSRGGLLQVFQQLDFMSLQGITAASVSAGFHSMCNGANLAYRKDIFWSVGGFAGHEHLASGDDMLLMHRIKASYPNQIGYIFSRDSMVLTEPAASWGMFFQQRIRWASKAESYREKKIFGVLLGVWLLNAALAMGLLLVLFHQVNWMQWVIVVLIKTIGELYFLTPVSRFFQAEAQMAYFPFLQPLHIVYTITAGWLGKFGSYQWKQRKIKTGGTAF